MSLDVNAYRISESMEDSMKLRTAVFILAAMLCANTGMAQTGQRRHPIRSKVVWTLVGAAAGTTIGAYAVWDDDERAAVQQDRMRRSMIVGGSVGGALGLWFGHHRSRRSQQPLPPIVQPESRPRHGLSLVPYRATRASGRIAAHCFAFPKSCTDPPDWGPAIGDYHASSAVSTLR
jgi:hypothetical protein